MMSRWLSNMRLHPEKILARQLLVIVSCAALLHACSADQASNTAAPAPLALTAIRLEPRTVSTDTELPGRTVAYKMAEIRPQVSGIITARLFKEGGTVAQGQQLYRIDPAPYQAAYDIASADLKKAEATVKSVAAKSSRYAELVKIEAVSRQEYDDLEASLAQAQADVAIANAALAQAKINLDYTRVFAPISGRIGKSRFTKGALVTTNQAQALTTITQLDPVYVDMAVSSSELLRLRQQLANPQQVPVSLLLEGSNQVFPQSGKLLFHEVTVDAQTGAVQLRAQFPNPDEVLLPGLFVRARLKLEYPDALLVPQRAASRQSDGSLAVWLVDNGKAKSVTLHTSHAVGEDWLVDAGLKAGDVVITEGTLKLQADAAVAPVLNPADTAPATPAIGGTPQ